MKVPSASPDAERELARLRRRAYGPDADIAADPKAAARLSELESAARGDRTPSRFADSADKTPPRDWADRTTPPATDGSGPETTAGRWRRHPIWVAAVTAALCAAIAIGVSFVSAGPKPDAALAATGDAPSSTLMRNISWLFSSYGVDPDTMVSHGDFAAVSVWTAEAKGERRCLFLTVNDEYVLERACMPAGLDPIIDIIIAPTTTSLVGRGTYPESTALRFVSRDDTVEIWVRSPSPTR